MTEIPKQVLRYGNGSRLASLAYLNMHNPPLKVKISDVEVGKFESPHCGLRESLQDAPIPEGLGGIDSLLDVCRRQVEFGVFELLFFGRSSYFLLSGNKSSYYIQNNPHFGGLSRANSSYF